METRRDLHQREVTNKYLQEECEKLKNYFTELETSTNFMGEFANFYKNFLKETKDNTYFIQIFQEVQNVVSTVRLN